MPACVSVTASGELIVTEGESVAAAAAAGVVALAVSFSVTVKL